MRYAEGGRAVMRWRFSSGQENGHIVLETADGPMSAAVALPSLADHTAHHLRQMYWLMERQGLSPREPLDPASLTGVSLQEQLW